MLGAAAQHVGEAVQVDARLALTAGDDQVLEVRHGTDGDGRQGAGLDGHLAPRDDVQLHLLGDGLDRGAHLGAALRVHRKERHAHGVLPGLGETGLDDGAQEAVRDLDQDAGAVTGRLVGTGGAAVVQVAQRLEPLLDDLVPGHAVEVRDEGDTTGVVLVGRVVQTHLLAVREHALSHLLVLSKSIKDLPRRGRSEETVCGRVSRSNRVSCPVKERKTIVTWLLHHPSTVSEPPWRTVRVPASRSTRNSASAPGAWQR